MSGLGIETRKLRLHSAFMDIENFKEGRSAWWWKTDNPTMLAKDAHHAFVSQRRILKRILPCFFDAERLENWSASTRERHGQLRDPLIR